MSAPVPATALRHKVAVLVIEHGQGTNVSAHPTKQAADRHMRSYVAEYWADAFPGKALDGGIATPDQAAAYWEEMTGRESHEIHDLVVVD